MAKTPKCLDILTAAMKKTKFMDEAAAIDYLKEIQERAAKKQESENMNRKDALQKSTDEIIAEEKAEAKQRERRVYLDIKALVLLRDFTKKDVFDSRSQGLNAALTGDLRYKPSQRNSLHYAMLNMQSELTGDLFRAMSKDKLFDEFVQNKSFQRDISKETAKPKSSGNDEAFLAAKHIKATNEKARKLKNKAGANIKEAEDFIANTFHNREQMLSATGSRLKNSELYLRLWAKEGWKKASIEMKRLAYVRWRNFIMPLLNRGKTFRHTAAKDVEDFMLRSYKALVTGRHLKDTIENTGTIGDFKKIRPISRVERENASKVFHFSEDGEGWFDYNNKYGTGSLATAIFRSFERSGKNIAILRRFGPSSTPNFNTMRDDILADSVERDSPGSTGRLNVAQHMWNWASGVSKVPVNQTLADWSLAFRQFVTLVRLPLVVITAFQDTANRAQAFRDHGINTADAWKKVFQINLKGVGKKERLEIASMFRVFDTGLMGTFASRMAAFDSPEGMMSNLMAKFWKYNGMNRWDRTNTQAHALALGSHLGSLRDLEFDNLPAAEKRLLLQYDIEQPEWDYYRKNATIVAGTDKTVFIAPDVVRQIGNKGLDDYLTAIGEDKTDAARENALEDLSEKLGMYFIDRTSHAILIPDLRESTLILGSSQPGTLYGEVMRNIALFKVFSISFARKLWGRKLYGGNLAGNKDILAIVEIMTTSTLMGMGILDLKLAGQGKEPREFGLDFITAGMLQGGGLGIWGDFLFGQYNRYGQTLTGTFIGPGLGTINDFASFIDKLVKMDHPGQAAAQFFGRNTPLLNMYFAKTALNYLFLYSLAEYLSPGYLGRMQRNLAKQQDEQFFAPPSQFALRPFG